MPATFFHSIKKRLSRTPTGLSNQSSPSVRDQRDQQSPPSSASTGGRRGSTSTQGLSKEPFSKLSPQSQPSAKEAPPAYCEVTGVPSFRTGAFYSDDDSGASRSNPTRRDVSPAPSRISAASISTPEDPYAFLSTFDTIFVIDDSGSMAGRSWNEVKTCLGVIAPICTVRDADGVDVYFLNHRSSTPGSPSKGAAAGGYRGITDAHAVDKIFSFVHPVGCTPTGTRLQTILKPYLQLCAWRQEHIETVKPINVIVITDGCPSDDVESVILSAAKKLDNLEAPPYQVGIQFFQVGNEPGAREALRELDDGISGLVAGGVRDMVDTVTWSVKDGRSRNLSADAILKTVLGAVIKRLDRLSADGGAPSRDRQSLKPR